MRFSADTAYRVEKSFLRFGLREYYVVDLHGRMNSCRLAILKKLKKFSVFLNSLNHNKKILVNRLELFIFYRYFLFRFLFVLFYLQVVLELQYF